MNIFFFNYHYVFYVYGVLCMLLPSISIQSGPSFHSIVLTSQYLKYPSLSYITTAGDAYLLGFVRDISCLLVQ